MSEITNDDKKLKDEIITKKELEPKSDNLSKEKIKEKTAISKSQETIASKAVKEAKKRVANEIKEDLKQEVSKTEKFKNTQKKIEKEETVIQKIKNFINKIIEMQEAQEKEDSTLVETEKQSNSERKSEEEPKYLIEYYDLPFRYNETTVKILAQTPKRLFVYWDISDTDRDNYKTAFGDKFFEETYPVLLVHNEDKNYTFEVPINDFANSWYLDINDSKSKYVIQLGRKFRTKPEFVNIGSTEETKGIELHNDYVPITTSNVLEVPNDHILFEVFPDKALYRNVKTNKETYVEIANSEFINKIGKIYNIYDLYQEIYKNELGEGTLTDLLNPSSMSSSRTSGSMFK